MTPIPRMGRKRAVRINWRESEREEREKERGGEREKIALRLNGTSRSIVPN